MVDYQQEILDCLSENYLGLTITDISKQLDISRNTVYKYLAKLEKHEKIYKKSLGRYNLYYSKERRLLRKEGILSFIKGLLANLKRTFPNQEGLFKEYGKNIAEDMIIPFSEEGRQYLKILKDCTDIELLEAIGEIFPHFNILQDSILISDINIIKKEKKAHITFVNSEFLKKTDDYIYYFYILCGIIEQKLSEYLGKKIRFDIQEFEEQNNFINVSFNLQILLPDMEVAGMKDIEIPREEDLDVGLIRKYFSPLTLSYMLFGVISKKRIAIVLDNTFLKKHLINFFQFIFEDSFEYNIRIEEMVQYRQNEKLYKNMLIMGEKKVIEDLDNKAKEREIKIERNIVDRFMATFPERTSLITIRKEVKIAYILAQELANKIIEDRESENPQKMDIKQLFENLEQKYNIQLVLPYIVFLTDIVENYFDEKVSDIWKFFTYRLS